MAQGLVLSDSKEVGDERKKAVTMTIVAEESKGVGQVVNIERFSTAERLLRVTSWVLRFLHNLKQKVRKEEPRSGCLKAEEMIMAEKMWIKDAQELLRRSVDYEKMRVQLGVIESEGVLVCKGRLENSDLEMTLDTQSFCQRNTD
eukprot:gene15558-biopygen13270